MKMLTVDHILNLIRKSGPAMLLMLPKPIKLNNPKESPSIIHVKSFELSRDNHIIDEESGAYHPAVDWRFDSEKDILYLIFYGSPGKG